MQADHRLPSLGVESSILNAIVLKTNYHAQIIVQKEPHHHQEASR